MDNNGIFKITYRENKRLFYHEVVRTAEYLKVRLPTLRITYLFIVDARCKTIFVISSASFFCLLLNEIWGQLNIDHR